jgi:phosphoserine phosphatase RsbU/P
LSEFDHPNDDDFAELYEEAPCGHISMTPDGHIVRMNRTMCAWIGLSQGQVVGKRLNELLTIAGRVFYETHFAPLLRMQHSFDEVALDFVGVDGIRLPIIANAVEKLDTSGAPALVRLLCSKLLSVANTSASCWERGAESNRRMRNSSLRSLTPRRPRSFANNL